jgi:acyl carrier protein
MIDTADRISNLIASKLRIDPGRINEATNFVDDLAVASLDMVETIMSLEDEFNVEISDRDSEKLRTVGDVIALIRTKHQDVGRANT